MDESLLLKTVRQAAMAAGCTKRATRPLKSGHDIRTIQVLLGQKGVSTTMIYTHDLNKAGHAVRSPMDAL